MSYSNFFCRYKELDVCELLPIVMQYVYYRKALLL